MTRSTPISLKILLLLAVLLNVLTWLSVRDVKGRWTNVPPVPSLVGATAFGMGDPQFAYRFFGLVIQNLGDTGGRVTKFEDYDYEMLGKWFFLQDQLDPNAYFIPYLASYYFGAVQAPEKLRPLITYLRHIGIRPEGEYWRWLAHAVYLARFVVQDQALAYELAQDLAVLGENNDKLPHWTRQMPAFVLNSSGNKEESLAFMIQMLKEGEGKMTRKEVRFTIEYICTRILDGQEAAVHPLCKDY